MLVAESEQHQQCAVIQGDAPVPLYHTLLDTDELDEDEIDTDNVFFQKRPLPRTHHRQAAVIEQMLANRNCTTLTDVGAREQAIQQSYVDAVGPRFGRVRVVFFNTEEHLAAQHGFAAAPKSARVGGSSAKASTASIGVDDMDSLLEMAAYYKLTHLILILASELTYVARGELIDSGLHFELFLYKEVAFNVIEHEWVPKYRLLSLDEKRFLLSAESGQSLCGSRGRVAENFDNPCTAETCFCLPRLLTDHTISRYYDFQHGDIVRVESDSPASGIQFKFRVVMRDTALQ